MSPLSAFQRAACQLLQRVRQPQSVPAAPRRRELSPADREFFLALARKTWHYFETLADAARQIGLGDPEISRTLDSARRTGQGRLPPSLAELLEAGPARTREPEPDLEAEP